MQREIENWNSNENSDSDKSSVHSSDGSRKTSTLQSESDETFQVYGRGKREALLISNRDNFVSVKFSNIMTVFFLHRIALESANRNRTMIKTRSRHLNRIAYLIATKRNTLKRLALKGSNRTTRRVRSVKSSQRKMQRSSFRQPRKNNGKRINRMVWIRIDGIC